MGRCPFRRSPPAPGAWTLAPSSITVAEIGWRWRNKNPACESRSSRRGEEACSGSRARRISGPLSSSWRSAWPASISAAISHSAPPRAWGPATFPIILSWVVFGIGVVVGFKGLTIEGPAIEPIQLRPILVIVSAILIFGYLIERVGLAITAALLTVLAGYARHDASPLETLLLAAALALFCVGLFVYGLSQPFPAWWGR